MLYEVFIAESEQDLTDNPFLRARGNVLRFAAAGKIGRASGRSKTFRAFPIRRLLCGGFGVTEPASPFPTTIWVSRLGRLGAYQPERSYLPVCHAGTHVFTHTIARSVSFCLFLFTIRVLSPFLFHRLFLAISLNKSQFSSFFFLILDLPRSYFLRNVFFFHGRCIVRSIIQSI